MADRARSRRSALKTLGLSVLGGAGLWRFLTPLSDARRAPAGEAISVALEEIPADGALVLPQHGVAVVRQGAALFALDLACTHLGCTVTATSEGFACPCHGSRFGTGGDVLAGPAPRPLRRIAAAVDGGVVRVDRGRAPLAACCGPGPAAAREGSG